MALLSVSSFITQTGTLVKTLLAAFALIAALSAFYVTGKAMLSVPTKLDQHATQTKALNGTMDKILCIMIADHRKIDWRLCYINPTEVLPVEYGTH